MESRMRSFGKTGIEEQKRQIKRAFHNVKRASVSSSNLKKRQLLRLALFFFKRKQVESNTVI
jgi:hypothetical protein